MRRGGKVFWGWYIVMAAFCIVAASYACRYCFGIFVKPMADAHHWSRSVVSVVASVMMVSYGVGGVFAGRLLDRMSPKWIITAGALLAATGLVLSSLATAPWHLYLSYGMLFGVASSFFGVVVCVSYVGKWFVEKKGIAIGLTTVGIGFGVLAVTPVIGYILKTYGWQAGFVFLGVLVLLVGIPLSQIFMGRPAPPAGGRLSGGMAAPTSANRCPAAKVDRHVITLRSVLADRRFWLLVFCYGMAILVEMSSFVHQVAFALECGIEEIAAASSLGMIGVTSIAGRFFYGWLSDRLRDPKYAASIGFSLMTAGMFVLARADDVRLLYLYAAVFGFGYGSLAPMMPILVADRFGRQILGSAYGVLTFFAAVCSSIGPVWGGWMYDTFGSYRPVWWINLALLTVISVCILALGPRAGHGRES